MKQSDFLFHFPNAPNKKLFAISFPPLVFFWDLISPRHVMALTPQLMFGKNGKKASF
jgi:hypothetical protein